MQTATSAVPADLIKDSSTLSVLPSASLANHLNEITDVCFFKRCCFMVASYLNVFKITLMGDS